MRQCIWYPLNWTKSNLFFVFYFHFQFQFKISIKDQIPKYFQNETCLITTQCIILEAESLGAKVQGATGIVKQFLVHKCGHEKGPKSGIACIKSMVSVSMEWTNKYHFFHWIVLFPKFDLLFSLDRLKIIAMWLQHKTVNFKNIYVKNLANRFYICTRKHQFWNNHRSLAERQLNSNWMHRLHLVMLMLKNWVRNFVFHEFNQVFMIFS